MRAAHVRASRAWTSCAPCIVRLDSSHSRARAEALYSTGRVMSEKRADMAISATPIQHTSSLRVVASSTRPSRMTHVAADEANCTTGTSCERNTSGA